MNKKIIYSIAGGIILLSLIAGGFVFYSNQRVDRDVSENMVLRKTQALDVEYLISPEDGRKAVFERYRLFDESGNYKNIGPEGEINITKDNAEVFLIHPDGTREDITSQNGFFTLRIVPPIAVGDYFLNFKLKTGEVFQKKLEFLSAKEVELQKIDLSRTEEFSGIDLIQDLLLRESRELTAFSLGDLDLKKATYVFYVNSSGIPYGGPTPVSGIDEYFWLDIELMDERQKGEHIFMAKIDGVWHYDIVNYPEDFK